ncbi:hypothetical protein CCR75_003472 [Bremia lactucae]|uniref:chitin synthase n=1 Tax=Bremia lactucae TaxID=4779 RepID=A0A976FKL5_BRELC|nr:hypothetical protein CCR75_003472 [Bremia lactucae]
MQVTVQSIVSTTLTAGVFIIGPALHGELHHILLTYAHYITLVPSFINVFTIYSFCNLHDLSWGTKGLHSDPLLAASLENRGMGTCKGGAAERRALKKSSSEESERLKDRKERFEAFRTKMLFLWISANLSIAVYVVYFSSSSAFFPKIFNFMAGINSCRLLGCIGHCLYIHTNVLRDSVFDKVKVFMVPTAIRKIRACSSTPLLQAITVPIPHYQGLEITTDYFGSRVKRGITRRGERRP